MNRDLLLGIGFFLLMGLGGLVFVWMNRTKIGVDQMREAQRSEVAMLARHVGVARVGLDQARRETDADKRVRLARQVIDAYSAALRIDGREALYYAERAEAQLLAGDREAARRDVARAKELEPSGDWKDLETRIGP